MIFLCNCRGSSSDSEDNSSPAPSKSKGGNSSTKNAETKKALKKKKPKPTKENRKSRRLSGVGKVAPNYSACNGTSTDDIKPLNKTRRVRNFFALFIL